jgi:hypothetical protein
MRRLPIDLFSKAGKVANDKREATMSVYGIVAFILNSAATIWIGGTFMLVYLASKALKGKADSEVSVLLRSYAHVSRGLFLPASIAAVALGLYLALFYWNIFTFWILFSLLLAGASIALGQLVLSPMLKELGAMDLSAGPSAESASLMERIVAVGRTDLVLLFGLVLTATLKAGWTNWLTWPLILIVVAAGVFFFLPRDLLPGQQPLARTRDFGGEPEADDDDDK